MKTLFKLILLLVVVVAAWKLLMKYVNPEKATEKAYQAQQAEQQKALQDSKGAQFIRQNLQQVSQPQPAAQPTPQPPAQPSATQRQIGAAASIQVRDNLKETTGE